MYLSLIHNSVADGEAGVWGTALLHNVNSRTQAPWLLPSCETASSAVISSVAVEGE